MLILSRRPGETLCLGDNIRVTVLGIQGKQVRLGIEVPSDVTVYREEVVKRVEEENRRALAASNEDVMVAAALWDREEK
jgi:carbon storage regulator